ncbi:hypothetical protein GYH30_028339, partial [Glycine max]
SPNFFFLFSLLLLIFPHFSFSFASPLSLIFFYPPPPCTTISPPQATAPRYRYHHSTMSPSPTKVTASPPTPFTKYIALRNGAPVGIAEDMMLRPDFDVEYFDGDVRSAVNF